MIKCIIFDVGGVVVSDNIRNYVHRTAAKHYNTTIEKIIEAMKKHEKSFNTLDWKEDEYWNKVAKDLKIDKPSPPRLIWTEKYEEMTPVNQDVINLIKKLKVNKYKLCVLSNTIQSHVDTNRKRGIYEMFDIEIFSCAPEIGILKPDIKIFEICLKKIESPAKECVFVDDLEENLIPAKKLGIKTILFKDIDQLKEDLIKLGVSI
ncbi:HAD family hydrolase [Candidatus Aenigmatarchaeota archaeon]